MTQTTLKVSGMNCGHCEKAVEQALAKVAGVTSVLEVNHRQQRVTVEGDAALPDLIAAIADEGYTAQAE